MRPGPRLEAKVGAVRSHLTLRTFTATALWVGAGVALTLVVAWVLAGPDGWRQGSDTPLVLDLLLVGCAGLAFLGIRAGIRRWFSEVPLSGAMERAAGLAQGMVRGSLEVARALPNGVSPTLAGRAVESVLGALGGSSQELAGGLGQGVDRWLRRGMGILAALTFVVIVLAVGAPRRAGRAWMALSTPLRVMADPVLPPLVLAPGTVEVLRGSDVSVRLEAPGRATAELVWQVAGDVSTSELLTLGGGVGVRVFKSVSAAVEYSARTDDGATTPTFRIVPVDPLFVSDLTLEVAYPVHTGLPPEEYRGTVPSLRLPVGTRLGVDGRASRDLSDAVLLGEDGETATRLSVDGARFRGMWRPAASGRFTWSFLDDDGAVAVVQPEPLDIILLPDSAPSVTIPIPGRDTLLALTLKQPLILEARDDYGLRRLELVAYRVTSFGEVHEPMTQGLDLGGSRAALARPLLDVTEWELLPGDEVRYFARAVDNAPEAQTTVSREYVLRMPDASGLRRGAQEQLEELAGKLEALAAEADRKADETRDMEREAAAKKVEEQKGPGRPNPGEEMGFEEKEELRKALDGQKELTGQVDSLRAELEALQEAMREAGQADPALSDDLKELQELLQQIAGEQLEQRLEALSEGLDQQLLQDANRSLEELAREQENFRDRLEESLERFRRAAVEQDFRATRSDMDELAMKEQALADAMKEGDRPELRAQQQEALEKDAAELQSRMDRLETRLEQLGEEDAAREVGKANEQAAQAQQQMKQAGERAKQQKGRAAGEKADQAADKLEEAADQLEEAQKQMAQQKAEEALHALEQTADDALSLARRQTELGNAMDRASQDQVSEMRGDEASLLQGVRNMAQNLMDAADGALSGNQEMTAQIGRAMESLQRTIQAMENRRGPTPAPAAAAEQAVNDLNQLALMALAGAEQMSGQQGQGQQGGEQTSEQLEQLAQQQGQLFNQTGQLTPMQLGEQALREQMEKLAEEQQSVAEDLGELSKDEQAREESLGDLEQLAAEAQALAQQMAEGRLTPDVLRRQERLFHRLLDAGRSLQKEDEDVSDERESKEAGAFDHVVVIPLSADQLGAQRFRMPSADQLQRLPPAVRQLVIQYFDRLNRGGGGQP